MYNTCYELYHCIVGASYVYRNVLHAKYVYALPGFIQLLALPFHYGDVALIQ